MNKSSLCISAFKTTVVWLLLLAFYSVESQEISRKFTHFGKQDGLNQSSVNYIFQDSEDYVWIANFGGINSFDGYSFTSYANDFDDVNSIPDNSVWTIFERKNKSLWFGTKAGLSKYNRESNNFTNYFIRKTTESAATLSIKALFEDTKERFYIGTEGEGLYLFNEDTKAFSIVTAIPKKAKVSSISEDTSGNLWVATENLGVFKIDKNRKQVSSLINDTILLSETVWSLLCDSRGDIWIGTDTQGLVLYNSKTNTINVFKDHSEQFKYKSGNKIKTITEDKNGLIWIGSATEGLSYYSNDEAVFYHYKNNPFDTNSLFDNDVSSIFPGNNNELYVGLYTKGFDKLITTPFYSLKNDRNKEHTLSNNNVYCIYKDKQEVLWFGTFGGGLNKYNTQTKTYKHYRHNPNKKSSISHDWIRIIYEDKNNTLWIGTWGGGLNKFDKTTETFKRYLPNSKTENTINHNIVTALFEDKNGELWIGTYGGGINIYQPETDDFKSIVHDKNSSNSISDDHITSFFQGENGLIWICTYGGGLNSYDKKTHTYKRYLPDTQKAFSLNNHKPLHIYKEPDSSFYWVTTLGGGINKFYYKENKFEHYTEKNGLSNNSTMGMIRDDKNNYWISSNNGISQFDPINETFKNYTTADGLASDDYNLEAYAETKDGTLYFGGKNGVTYFNPKNVKQAEDFSEVVITKVKVEDSIYRTNAQKAKIPYKSRVSFNYAVINAPNINNIYYAYQLVGQDNIWREMNKNRYLEFTNLNPGKYELRLKSTNSSAIWNKDYSSYYFTVPTPWYMSWFFRIGVSLMILMLVFSYYRAKLLRARQRNIDLEHKVEERTLTIKNKNRALAKEKEKTEGAYTKLKKLEVFKNELTSMIAHDLKNPLVTILNYSAEHDSDRQLQGINKSGNVMLNLIENMLEVQKFESTTVSLDLQELNLKTTAGDAIKRVYSLAEDKRIHVINKINASAIVHIDRELIIRVFVNLLSNAIKFSSYDSKVEIETKIYPKDPDKIVVRVTDYGVGIPEEVQAVIFDKFAQIEAKNSGKIRSTGLGLTFCKMAVEAHHGQIWIDSKPNHGSTFLFTLPKLKDAEYDRSDDFEDSDSSENYTNPLYELSLNENDFSLLEPHKEKFYSLSIYEMGEWLDIFDTLVDEDNTINIKTWKRLMMESLTSFDEHAFTHLKSLVLDSI